MSKKRELTEKLLNEYQMHWGFNYKQLVKDIRKSVNQYDVAYNEQFNREYNVEVIAYTQLLYFISTEVQDKGYYNYKCKYKYLDYYNRENNGCINLVIDCLVIEIAKERIRIYDREV